MDDSATIGAVQTPVPTARLLDPPALVLRSVDHRLHVLARSHAAGPYLSASADAPERDRCCPDARTHPPTDSPSGVVSCARSAPRRASCAGRGYSQESLSFRAEVHRNYIGGIERGELNITFRVLLKITHGLHVPLSELIAMYERNRAATGEVRAA